jgi:5-methylcytosine-specific restriction enzyme A
MQFCQAPDCGVLVPHGHCPAHAPRALRSRPGYALVHRWLGSRRWQQLRAEVLRDDPFCRACPPGRRRVTADIDHIIPHGGDPQRFWDRANLQGLCKSCHARKTARGA